MLACTAFSFAQKNSIEQFYPLADSVASYPPVEDKLTILCQKKIDQYYVSFIRTTLLNKALMVVVTPARFNEPDSISLTVGFNGYKPTTGKVTTWGYVFDRNFDGKIDYMALMSGAAPFKSADFPARYPLRKEYFSKGQLEYFINHSKLIFNHWADDNYDGMVDAVVHIDMDSTRDWVERRFLARSKAFNGSFDDVWGFRESIGEDHEEIPYRSDGIPFHSLTNVHDTMTRKMFDAKSGILQLLNKAAKACRLTADKFVHPERKDN